MKKWLNNKKWFKELVYKYKMWRWQKRAMKAYVEHLNGKKYEKIGNIQPTYVGDIQHDWLDRIDAKIAEKKTALNQ